MKKLLLLLLCLPFFGLGQDIYFSKNGTERIKASNDGLTQTAVYTAPSGHSINAVRIDNINNKIYWDESVNQSNNGRIMRSDLGILNPQLVISKCDIYLTN